MNAKRGWERQAVVVAILLLAATMVWGAHSGYHKVADGVAVYFAIVPAEMVRGHPREHPEGEMHSSVPTGENHIMIALFDDKTGKRIVRAEVSARVSGGHASSIEKRLESMVIAGNQTYGNYFPMTGSGPYTIDLRIYAPGRNKPISMRFEWSRS